MRDVHVPLSFAVLALFAAQPICQASDLSTGEDFYKKGNYVEAKNSLGSAVKANPQNAVAHYLLGNVLVKLNKQSDAIEHYEAAARLKPAEQEGRFSQQALLDLRGMFRKPNIPLLGAGNAANNDVSDDARSHRELTESVSKIGKATDAAKSEAEIEYNCKVKQITEESQKQVRAIEDEQRDYLYANRAVWSSKAGAYIYTPDNEPAKAAFAVRIATVQKDTRKRMDQEQLFFKQRQIATEESAIALDQTYQRGSTGTNTARLVPRGSSLYIRNYETEQDPSGDAVPLLGQTKALSDKTCRQVKTPAQRR